MRRTGYLMVAILAACALAALDAGVASAELPEIGRCVKVEGTKEGHRTKFNGKYSNKKCTTVSSTGTGKFEWMAGPGEEKGFESPGTLEPVTLETPSGTAVVCKDSKQFGEYLGPNTEKDEISLYECTLSTTGETCQSVRPEEIPPLPEAGTIISQALEGKLGYIKKSALKPQIGWEYKAKTGPFLFIFECGSTPLVTTDITIEGAFISPIIKPVNRMAEEYKLHSVAAGGKQTPEMFEGGAKATLTAAILEPKALKATTEAIAFSAPEEEQSFSEDMEFKAAP
ncbi:MAG TPA: hypothetical protein VMI13_05955 [Solirubrobacteraceae bacterium]|nr:hypothetical protein [Solirubrobacteraceae bacterium]